MSGVGFEKSRKFRVTELLGALIVLVTLALSIGVTSPESVSRSITDHTVVMSKVHDEPVPPFTFTGTGDSITARAEQGSRYEWQSWTLSADTTETRYVAGGWAEPGRTTDDMLAGTVPLDYVDVLVFEGAVNDVNLHRDHAGILANISAIVTASTVGHILIVALPPNDRYPADALAFNAELEAYAYQQGWGFSDPWTPYRNTDGTYVPGAAWDDLHPTQETAIVVGLTIRDAMRHLMGGTK